MAVPTTEYDPFFLRGIALLRSSHPCSGKLLKSLVEEAKDKDKAIDSAAHTAAERRAKILLSYRANKASSVTVKEEKEEDEKKIDISEEKASEPTKDRPATQGNDSTSQASSFEVVETIEEIGSSSNSKTVDTDIQNVPSSIALEEFQEAVEELSSSAFDEKPKQLTKTESETTEVVTSSNFDANLFDASTDGMVALEDIMEMDFAGPNCEVCDNCVDNSVDNRLVQCHDCHRHFHQKCHAPPVTNKDVSDPRLVWYCAKCARQTEKAMAALASNSGKNSRQQQHPERPSPFTNPFQQNIRPQVVPFRRPSSGNLEGVTESATFASEISSSQGGRRNMPPLVTSSSRPDLKRRSKLQQLKKK